MTYHEAVVEIYYRCKKGDWIYAEVINKFIQYCQNSGTENYEDHMNDAFLSTAHE